jgi:quinol monooxygenase YgiN
MLHVVAHIKAKREHVDAVRAALIGFVAPTRAEAGCVVYDLFQNLDDPTRFTFVEEWTDKAALDVHGRSAHITSGRATLKDLVEGPTEILLYSRLA